MIPTIGRIVHWNSAENLARSLDDADPCRAALVTSVDYGAGKPVKVYLTVFEIGGHARPAPLLSVIVRPDVDGETWHDPRVCPRDLIDKGPEDLFAGNPPTPLWGDDGPAEGLVITIAGTNLQARWTNGHWERSGW